MKKIIPHHCFIACICLFPLAAAAQPSNQDSVYKKSVDDSLAKYLLVKAPLPEGDENFIYEKIEVEPRVNVQKWRNQLENNLRKPIGKAAKNGMKAGHYTVLVRFLVEKDGTITDVKALNDPGYGLGEASANVVRTGPRWIPGEHKGKKVRSYHTQPITFVISEK